MRKLPLALLLLAISAVLAIACDSESETPTAGEGTPTDTPGVQTPTPTDGMMTPTPGTTTPTPGGGTPSPTPSGTPTGPSGIIPYPDATPSPIATRESASGMPPEVEESLDQWPLPQGDYAGTRSTAGSGIDSDTVADLGLSWTFEVEGRGAFGALATNPIVLNDTVYVQDLGSNVYAVDLETGEVQWEAIYNEASIGPNGVAVGWDKVFAPISPKEFAALDIETGEEIWTAELDLAESEGIDIQPIVYDDMVLLSTVPGSSAQDFYAGNATGKIYALDQESGDILWRFDTVMSEDLWGNPEVNSGGGAWYPASIDAERGMTYWGIGNPAPYPGNEEWPNGTSRPGPNLYTASVVALNGESGELEWYKQSKPHDIFDLDFQNTPILTSAEISGETHDLAIGSGKDGTVKAIDRETGELLWDTPVGVHQYDMMTALPEGETFDVMPGVYGGVETPMAYAAGYVYVPIVNLATPFTSTTVGQADFAQATGELVAIEVATGHIAWKQDLPQMALGGATVVNDLVFTALYDGTIYAFNRASGELVWEYKLPIGINGQPAVVGDTIIWPAGVQQGDMAPGLIAMRVGADQPLPNGDNGTPTPSPTPGAGTPTPTDPAETPSPTPTGGATATPGNGPSADAGAQLVQQEGCLACHSTDGGTMIGPTFAGLFESEVPLQGGGSATADEAYLHESIVSPNAKIHEGFPSGVMPQNFGEQLTEEQIQSIIEYIKTL